MLNTADKNELYALMLATWHNSVKMADHCTKSSCYIKIDDLFVDVCSMKPSITKTIWYDDTHEGPDANFQNFRNLNERDSMPHLWELERRGDEHLCFGVQYNSDKSGGRIVSPRYVEEGSRDEFIRRVTAEELDQINAAIKIVQDDYSKRLVAYFKRYGQHVTSQGYWADR